MASLVEKAATQSKLGSWCVGILIIFGLGPAVSLVMVDEETGVVMVVVEEVTVVQVKVGVAVVLIMIVCDDISQISELLFNLLGFNFSAESWSLDLLFCLGVRVEISWLSARVCVSRALSIFDHTVLWG